MAKKKNKELKNKSSKAYMSMITGIIMLIASPIIPFVITVEEKDKALLFVAAGVLALFCIAMIYVSYCAIYKMKDKEGHSSKVEEEYNKIVEMQAKPEAKRKITSKEFEERLKLEDIERKKQLSEKRKISIDEN